MNAILESLNALSAAGLAAVLNTLWLALALIALMWFALRLMPRINAATRHQVWWTVLALIVLMPLISVLRRPVLPVVSSTQTDQQFRAHVSSSSTHVSSSSRGEPHHVTAVHSPALTLTSGPLHQADRYATVPHLRIPIEFHPGNWPLSFLLLWVALSSVLLSRIVLSYYQLRGLRKRARPATAAIVQHFERHLRESGTGRAPQLLVSDEVISPFAAGFLRPVVILPDVLLEEIAEAELDYVLLHELAHIARRDDWTHLMDRLASAVLVFHPVAAWVLHRIKREREIACDDWVVAATGSAVSYAVTLGRLFEVCSAQRRELLATEMAHRSSNIVERIETLLQPRRHFSRKASLPRLSFCVAAALALLTLGVRIPGWMAFAKDTPVAVASSHVLPQSNNVAVRVALAHESGEPQLVASLTPVSSTQGFVNSQAISSDQDKTWRHEWKLTRQDSSSSKVRLSLISRNDDGNDRTNTEDVPLSSLSGFSLSMLDHDGPVKFEYVRKSGSILCEGQVVAGRASGPFTVALNPAFVSALGTMGYAAPHGDEAFSVVTSDVTLGYAQAIRETGLTSSIADLIELEDHGVSSDYVRAVRQEGFTNLSASDISSLRDHGVNASYLKAIKAADPNLTIDAINGLFDHGVKPDYYKSMKAVAPQLSIGKINSLFDHGVEPDSYKGFASVDPKLSVDEIDSLRDHGVKPEYYRSIRSVAPNLSIEKIDSLFDHGVEPDLYKGFVSGDPNLSIEEIDSLRDHGVKPEYYQGIRSVAPKLSIEEIDSLFDHGVKPESYKGFASADPKLSIEEVDTLRDHGVDPEYLSEIRTLPDGFSITDITELRDHGITAKYVQKLHDMGMKKLTATQIVHLREGD